MSDKVIIKPDITPEERINRLNKVEAVISQITGYQCKCTNISMIYGTTSDTLETYRKKSGPISGLKLSKVNT